MRKLRMGMVGGGPGSFIGPVHRLAAEMDGHIELVAGAFSGDRERCLIAGEAYRVDPQRSYVSWADLVDAKRQRADRIDFVSIVAPNHLHLPIARDALCAGFPVICDKPMTSTLAEARELARLVESAGPPFRLTYTYTGYPLVREARRLVADGAIGSVRKVVGVYSQGWLARAIEHEGSKQAEWRVDRRRAGEGGCIGDIGVHAFNLAEFVTGHRVMRVNADLNSIVEGRGLDDDCNVLLRFDNGAPGTLIASQIAIGDHNDLRLSVYGDQASLHWRQEQPNTLTINRIDGATELRHAGTAILGPEALAATRLPPGHPEGYLEAFANIYRDFARLLRGDGDAVLVPGAPEGLRGLNFVATAIESSRRGTWVELEQGTEA